MIGLDTNVVIRVLVGDDRKQAARARELLERAAEESEPALISDLVVMELEWVLESAYGASRKDIVQAVQALLADPGFAFEDRGRVARALERYENGRGDLSDHLIGERAVAGGARTTFTFDRALRDDEPFTLL